jgi:hypothetical protein
MPSAPLRTEAPSSAPAVVSHPFDEAIRLEPLAGGAFRGATHPEYWNQVGPFGGITAAVMLNAVMLRPERLGDPLSLTVNYAGPVREGAFTVETRLLRSNRTTQHWAMELVQGPEREVAISAILVCALRRDTFALTEDTPPPAPPAADCHRVRGRTDLPWLAHYDMRYVRGRPMQENADSVTHLWVADLPARPLDFPALAAICDVFFPRLYLRRPKFVPIGTVSLNVYFHHGAETLARNGARHVLASAHGRVASAGFFDQEGQVWSDANELLATTHQIVWFKE